MNKPFFKIHDNLFGPSLIDTLYGSFRDEKPWKFIGGGGPNLNHRKFQYVLNKKMKSITFYLKKLMIF